MAGPSRTFPALPELAEHHFRHWKSVFEHLTGIQLSTEREGFVRSVLQKRVLEKGLSGFENYLHQLISSPAFGRMEWEVLFDRIVIGETRFFRHRPTFDFLSGFVRERLRGLRDERLLRAWSLGCSTGEEAYSLAMVMFRVCKGVVEPASFSVIGTDINRSSIEFAGRGIYKNIQSRGIEPDTARAFFDGQGDGLSRVKGFLRSKVTFFCHNMLEPATSSLFRDFDVICCQNVLIYLQRWRRRAVIRQIVSSLRIGGVLIVGPGELSGWKPDGLERLQEPDVQAYRRVI